MVVMRRNLRKVNIERSPGGTPAVSDRNYENGTGLTPMMTRALRRKFQVHSIKLNRLSLYNPRTESRSNVYQYGSLLSGPHLCILFGSEKNNLLTIKTQPLKIKSIHSFIHSFIHLVPVPFPKYCQ